MKEFFNEQTYKEVEDDFELYSQQKLEEIRKAYIQKEKSDGRET